MKLKDTLWIWGQDPGSHHAVENNLWNLPGTNRMGPVEGCADLGIRNCCRVVMNGKPVPPFDKDASVLDGLDRVVWSIIGDGGSDRNNGQTDLDEVLRIAPQHPNMIAAIMDDFMNEKRMAIYTPDRLKGIRDRLHTAIPGRPLDLWTVLYTHELDPKASAHLEQVDAVTLWTWSGKDLPNLEENLARLREFSSKPLLAGCYFFDYGGSRPLSPEWMQLQLETYYKWLKEGTIKGVIFCSNCVQDIGLPTVDLAKAWIRTHGDEELPE